MDLEDLTTPGGAGAAGFCNSASFVCLQTHALASAFRAANESSRIGRYYNFDNMSARGRGIQVTGGGGCILKLN